MKENEIQYLLKPTRLQKLKDATILFLIISFVASIIAGIVYVLFLFPISILYITILGCVYLFYKEMFIKI